MRVSQYDHIETRTYRSGTARIYGTEQRTRLDGQHRLIITPTHAAYGLLVSASNMDIVNFSLYRVGSTLRAKWRAQWALMRLVTKMIWKGHW